MKDLGGLKIIVTGGAGSIGHATACVLAAKLRETVPAGLARRKHDAALTADFSCSPSWEQHRRKCIMRTTT
jgi:NAD(P)-dependent dehydrogenase (short-subunit alcohol dehydrogenase family)